MVETDSEDSRMIKFGAYTAGQEGRVASRWRGARTIIRRCVARGKGWLFTYFYTHEELKLRPPWSVQVTGSSIEYV